MEAKVVTDTKNQLTHAYSRILKKSCVEDERIREILTSCVIKLPLSKFAPTKVGSLIFDIRFMKFMKFWI